MKWGKTFVARRALLQDPKLRAACIDYRALKKVPAGQVGRSRLERDCRGADAALRSRLRSIDGSSSRALFFFPCLGRSGADPAAVSELLEFLQLNATTLRKICKRVDKAGGGSRHGHADAGAGAGAWLHACTERRAYGFLDPTIRTRLRLRLPRRGHDDDCPVCFEPLAGDDCAVLPCGHPLCRRCVCAMCRVSELRGRLHNVLSFARYHGRGAAVTCPLCRTRCPTAHLVCH